jgi:hypothetical protein
MAVGELLLPHVVYLSDFIVSKYPQLDLGMASVEDVVQETLTEAYRQITEFDPNGSASLRTWLAAIMNRGPRAVQGLLPRVSDEVITVYVEATAEDTEARLLHRLRDGLSALQDKLARREPLPALRRGESAPVGKKVLIVLLKGTLLCRT